MLFQAIILGLVQGLTEFIPVSSSGHLILVGHLLGFHSSGLAFDTALDIGTLAALLAFFWRDFWNLFISIFKRTAQSKLAYLLILGTLPAIFFGVLLQGLAESVFRSDALVAVNLIVIGLVMLVADRLYTGTKQINNMKVGDSLGIGLAQAAALVPGVSRSGITISAGMFAGYDRVSATRFSFLLSAPVIAGATLKVLLSDDNLHQLLAHPSTIIAGILAAFVSGYIAIGFLLRYLSKHGLSIFAYYRLAIGVIVLVTLALH